MKTGCEVGFELIFQEGDGWVHMTPPTKIEEAWA